MPKFERYYCKRKTIIGRVNEQTTYNRHNDCNTGVERNVENKK